MLVAHAMRLDTVLPLMAFAGAMIGFLVGQYGELNVIQATISGFLIGFSPLLLLFVAGLALSMLSPDRPECICRQCKSSEYSYDDMDLDKEDKPYAFRYHCPKCGRSYILRDKQFLEINNDQEILYKKLNKWGRWSSC